MHGCGDHEGEKKSRPGQQGTKSCNKLYNTTRLLDLLPADIVSYCVYPVKTIMTYSAFFDTKRAFTMNGSLGSLEGDTSILREERWVDNTHCPLPKTFANPWRRVSITGTTSDSSVKPSFSSAGTSVQSLSTLMIVRQCALRVKWK